ncbi:hypothetical protein GY21_00660 [Cryobacterium roopkundense]|uniref:Uncharacterized protein n=1 Tax=Cryobacterium roopkundense TaxID=1001240 RepID=A0A099JY56_9MICO|nr:hypothetical protein [Cryobacterium roopkundense]KGJ82318.1 hypothetical protein GY21_00660 [Cryobacterium roopkundense]MBB5639475.1 hypothetical protein [Cryobacterium roopkundense]
MDGAFWWVPSIVVLAFVAAGVGALVGVARRRTRARLSLENAEAAELARGAAISLVRADDLVQDTTDELGFAIAQFGESATRDFATALGLSRRQLTEAFALQQKLDDVVPDSPAEVRRWNEQIRALADEASQRLTAQTRDFARKRGVERTAPQALEQLVRRLDHAQDRVISGAGSLDRLSRSYTAHALAPISGNVARAQAAVAEARRAADAAAALLAAGDPVGEQMSAADHALFASTQLLDAIESGEDELHIGFANLGRATDAAVIELAEARGLRDSHEEADTSASLNRVIAEASAVLDELRVPGRLCDPAADLARLRQAMDGLDVMRSEARNRQLRLENARTALAGALLTARSQITITRDFTTANRGRVQAAARTRLSEAERQLTLAEAEADPVIALDTARRAMTLATDADALARYDAR